MKLLTQKILQVLPKRYATEDVPLDQKIVVCKFFIPWMKWRFYVLEGDVVKGKEGRIDVELFGLSTGYGNHFDYFDLSELQSVYWPWGLCVKRDKSVFNKPLKEMLKSDGIDLSSLAA